jgi:hypothetical protein
MPVRLAWLGPAFPQLSLALLLLLLLLLGLLLASHTRRAAREYRECDGMREDGRKAKAVLV